MRNVQLDFCSCDSCAANSYGVRFCTKMFMVTSNQDMYFVGLVDYAPHRHSHEFAQPKLTSTLQ